MRYVVLVLFAIVSTILSGSVFSGLNLAGIQVDIVLLIVLALALVDKSGAAIIFAAGTGLFMDIMYSTVLGVYALSYTVAAAIVFLAFRNKEKFNVLILLLVGAAGYVIKETVMALIVYVLGARFDFLSILVRYTLPTAALTGGLLIVAYLLFARLYKNGWMRPAVAYRPEDF